MIGDKAYDSDRLDYHLATEYDIELIAPHNRRCTRKPKTAGRSVADAGAGRSSGFAWLHNVRLVVTRWECDPDNVPGMIHLAAAVILLRHFEMS